MTLPKYSNEEANKYLRELLFVDKFFHYALKLIIRLQGTLTFTTIV